MQDWVVIRKVDKMLSTKAEESAESIATRNEWEKDSPNVFEPGDGCKKSRYTQI